MTFSSLTKTFDLPTNHLYEVRSARLKSKQRILDLVAGDVSAHGIAYPATALQQLVKEAITKAARYRPDPLGQVRAREAISNFYQEQGAPIPASQLVLTPGTSISYWYCFKLLCNSGDEILCPHPSYPLFESIASLSAIKLVPYPLIEGKRWFMDFQALENKITERTRAIVLISPHNPTGAVATSEEIRGLTEIAVRRGLTIIHDEVFSPFVFNQKILGRPIGSTAPLVLTLNGFSKMFALAGMKIGWIGVTGESAKVEQALKTLDMISDTFLPTNEWAQAAVPGIFERGSSFLQKYQRAIIQRSAMMLDWIQKCPGLSVIKPEGGFFMTVRLDRSDLEEEEFTVQLLNREGVLVHPGFFYDMPGRHIVLSSVARPMEMRQAFIRIKRYLNSFQ